MNIKNENIILYYNSNIIFLFNSNFYPKLDLRENVRNINLKFYKYINLRSKVTYFYYIPVRYVSKIQK